MELLELWEKAIPLSQASITFMHPSKKQTWKALNERSAIEAINNKGEEIAAQRAGSSDGNSPSGMEVLAEIAEAVSGVLIPRTEFRKELEADLLHWAKQSRVIGIGFQETRRLDDVPVKLPSSVWSGQIDWTRGRVSSNGLNFIEVRLLPERYFKPKEEQAESRPQPTRGRPSLKEIVLVAIEELQEADQINTENTKISHYEIIRERAFEVARRQESPLIGISDETIRKYFSSIFNDLKKSQKQ